MGYIYVITNVINNKKYIGQTIQLDINQRWNKHKQVNKKFIGTCLYNSYKKYGIENFKFKIICICFDEDTDKFEEEYIKKYNTLYPNGYNMIEGGKSRKFTSILKEIISNKLKGENHPMYGKHLKEETKRKLSEALKGEKNHNFGKTPSQETINKLRQAAYKRHEYTEIKCAEKTKEKISNSLIEYYKNDDSSEKKKNNVKVEQYDLNNNLINTYYSLSEAARSVNVSSTNIIYASNLTSTNKNNKPKTCKGYIWKRI